MIWIIISGDELQNIVGWSHSLLLIWENHNPMKLPSEVYCCYPWHPGSALTSGLIYSHTHSPPLDVLRIMVLKQLFETIPAASTINQFVSGEEKKNLAYNLRDSSFGLTGATDLPQLHWVLFSKLPEKWNIIITSTIPSSYNNQIKMERIQICHKYLSTFSVYVFQLLGLVSTFWVSLLGESSSLRVLSSSPSSNYPSRLIVFIFWTLWSWFSKISSFFFFHEWVKYQLKTSEWYNENYILHISCLLFILTSFHECSFIWWIWHFVCVCWLFSSNLRNLD